MADALAVTDQTDPLGTSAPDDLEPMIGEARANMQQVGRQVQGDLRQQQTSMRGLDQSSAAYRQAAAGRPQPPQMPEAPDGRVTMEAAGTWIAAATVFGAIAGAMTRRSSVNALAAFTGSLEGLKEGNQIKFEQNSKLWEQENKRIYQQWQMQDNAYQRILDDKKLDMDTKMFMVQQRATQLRDDMMAKVAAQRDVVTLAQLKDRRADAIERAKTSYETLQERIRHNKTMEGQGQEQSMDARAQAIAKYQLPPVANPRNPQDRAMMAKVMELNPGYDAKRYSGEQSGAKSTGTRLANLEGIQRSVNALVPQALAASAAVSRTRFVPVNEAIQMVQSASSTPELEAFATVNINLAEQWARSQKPTGVLDVELQKIALGRLSTAKSDQAYRTVVKTMVTSIRREAEVARQQQQGVPMEEPEVPGGFVPPPLNGGGAMERKTLNGKSYYKQNGQWYEENSAPAGDRS